MIKTERIKFTILHIKQRKLLSSRYELILTLKCDCETDSELNKKMESIIDLIYDTYHDTLFIQEDDTLLDTFIHLENEKLIDIITVLDIDSLHDTLMNSVELLINTNLKNTDIQNSGFGLYKNEM